MRKVRVPVRLALKLVVMAICVCQVEGFINCIIVLCGFCLSLFYVIIMGELCLGLESLEFGKVGAGSCIYTTGIWSW